MSVDTVMASIDADMASSDVLTAKSEAPSPHLRFYDHQNYPTYESAVDELFRQRYNSDRFGLGPDSVIAAHDGEQRTATGHFEHILALVKDDTRDDAPGFTKTGEKDGVLYEMHAEKTKAMGGAGYFRLTGEIQLDATTFVALMADPHSLYAMDKTIRLMDFARGPSYPDKVSKSNGCVTRRFWLAYFRQAPGMLLPDLDGIDVSGWEIEEATKTVWQVAIGVPDVLPTYPAALTKLYPPAFRSVDMIWGYKLEPLGPQRTKLTLVCQHDLRNWMVPHFASNRMVCDVLADYVRTAERVGKKLVEDGKATELKKRHALDYPGYD